MANLDEKQKTMAKGTFWGLSGTILVKLVSLAYTIILARSFTQADVGLFYLALSVISILAVFGDLGMSSAFNRYVPFYIGKGEKAKAYNLLKASYLFSGALSLVLAGAVFLLSGQIASALANPLLATPLQFLSVFLLVNTLYGLNIAFLNGLKKIKEMNLIVNGQNLLKLALTVGLFFMLGSDAFIIAFAFTASYFVFLLVSFWYVEGGVKENNLGGEQFGLSDQIGLLKETVPFGITIGLIVGIANLAAYTDRIMMGYLLPVETSAAQIGIYSIAISMALLIPVFSASILGIFTPIAAEIHGKGDKKDMEEVSRTAVRWNVFLLAPFSVLMIVFPGEILQMFYGSAYAGGALVLAIFAIGTILRMLTSIEGAVLSSMRIIRVELYAAIVTLLLNVALNWLLIPVFGMVGSALASATSLLVASIMIGYYCRKIAGFSFVGEALKPLFAGIITLAVVFLVKENALDLMNAVPAPTFLGDGLAALILQKLVKLAILGLLFGLACAIYAVCVLALRAAKKEDFSLAFSGLRRAGVPKGWVSRLEGWAGGFSS